MLKIRFCPKCKSTEVNLFVGGITGKYKCKKCGYVGIFPEKEVEK